jgi:excisionase family DNA binding protein
MAGTYSSSILEGKSPQYAYALVVLSGGIAVVIPQLGSARSGWPLAAWFFYALVAALFSFVWPYKAWQWAVWVCLPIFVLICFDILVMRGKGIMRSGPLFIKALMSAGLGVYAGLKLSRLKISSHYERARVNRRRLSRQRAESPVVLTEPVSLLSGGKFVFQSQHSNGSAAKAAQEVARRYGLNGALLNAAREGDHQKIRLLVGEGADVNVEGGNDWTPLMTAALDGDVETVKALFGGQVNGDAQCDKGWTALMTATVEGHMDVVRELIAQGVQVDARNNRGWTALRFAVSMDEPEILRLLLDAGADANICDEEGETALMQAARENLPECLQMLLDAGAYAQARDMNGQTALMIARSYGHTGIIKLLKEAEAKAAASVDAPVNLLSGDDSYLYLLKEELEEMLQANTRLTAQAADDAVSRLLSVLQTVREQLDAAQEARSLAPSEISHKLTLTVQEASTLSGLPRAHLLEAIEARSLKAQRIKHTWRITRAELDDYLSRLS